MTEAELLAANRYSLMPQQEIELWAAYSINGGQAERELIFRFYQPLVKRLALRFYRPGSGSHIEFSELYQLASTGLLESIDRFRPDLGIPFRYFANRRISGAILNGIAIYSEVDQQISVRRRIARERLASLKGTQPPKQLDDALDLLGEIAAGLALGLMLEDTRSVAIEGTDCAKDAFETIAWKQMINLVRKEISMLPPRESDMMIWHYIDGLHFQQVADIMGLTRSRVSQMHKAAISLLRKRLLNAGHFRLEG